MKFCPVTTEHKDLIVNWLHKPHVTPYYYGEGLQNTLDNLELYVQGIRRNAYYAFDLWIAEEKNTPFGFLMTTPVEGPYDPQNPYNKHFKPGQETITLDLLIGEEAFLGKGLSVPMIEHFLADKFPTVAAVLIDPAADNTRAIHIYEKAGFQKLEQFLPAYDPTPHWMMKRITPLNLILPTEQGEEKIDLDEETFRK